LPKSFFHLPLAFWAVVLPSLVSTADFPTTGLEFSESAPEVTGCTFGGLIAPVAVPDEAIRKFFEHLKASSIRYALSVAPYPCESVRRQRQWPRRDCAKGFVAVALQMSEEAVAEVMDTSQKLNLGFLASSLEAQGLDWANVQRVLRLLKAYAG